MAGSSICRKMTQAGKAVIGQQEGTEAGASGDNLGAPFSLPASCALRERGRLLWTLFLRPIRDRTSFGLAVYLGRDTSGFDIVR